MKDVKNAHAPLAIYLPRQQLSQNQEKTKRYLLRAKYPKVKICAPSSLSTTPTSLVPHSSCHLSIRILGLTNSFTRCLTNSFTRCLTNCQHEVSNHSWCTFNRSFGCPTSCCSLLQGFK